METLLACLTPPGKAAIATISVRGPLAWEITRQHFDPTGAPLPEQPISGRCWFGRFGLGSRDEIILTCKETGPSTVLELHCHGGVEVVRMIEELYEQQAVRVVSWQQFHGSAELLDLLARAPTTRCASILLDQWSGAWAKCMQNADASVRRRLRDLIPLGKHLVEPWRVVIAGVPNVGKSSLMNALAGYDRSVVSAAPGTTRDVVTAALAIDGWPIEMVDTAGLRIGVDDLEQQGIARARGVLRTADLRLWLLDASTEPAFPENRDDWCLVINKTDLPPAWDWSCAPTALRVSAHTRVGLSELCDWISHRLVPTPPAPGEAVPCLPEQVAQIRIELETVNGMA